MKTNALNAPWMTKEWTRQERLEALAAFLPVFSDPGFKFGEWHRGREDTRGVLVTGWFETGAEASRFLKVVYEFGFVRDFDWGTWIDTEEAQDLRLDPPTLARAGEEEIAKLLTAVARADRFCEGALESAFESGLLTRIVQRAAILAGRDKHDRRGAWSFMNSEIGGNPMIKGFDVIGDIHGHADELHRLLKQLDYAEADGTYRHPERTALFLGDFIDRGKEQREVLRVVRRMCEAGSALAIMGNHEFNAIAWATKDAEGNPLRGHDEVHREQHAEFLSQLGEGTADYHEALNWFWTLPVALDVGGLRAVHACWHQPSLDVLARECLDQRGRFTAAGMQRAHERGSAARDAAEIVLKGPEVELSNGLSFSDKQGHVRREARLRWWDPTALTYRTATLGMEGREDELPDAPLPALYSYDQDVPVLFGHYWLRGKPTICAANATCLDFSVAKGGYLAAYRWSGEKTLAASNLVWVRSGKFDPGGGLDEED